MPSPSGITKSPLSVPSPSNATTTDALLAPLTEETSTNLPPLSPKLRKCRICGGKLIRTHPSIPPRPPSDERRQPRGKKECLIVRHARAWTLKRSTPRAHDRSTTDIRSYLITSDNGQRIKSVHKCLKINGPRATSALFTHVGILLTCPNR